MSILKKIILGLIMAVPVSAIAIVKEIKIEGTHGKEVHLSVESNPTTGYKWMIKSLPKELIFVSTHYKESENCKKGAVGCSGKEMFTFIAQNFGTGELKLIYGQTFDVSSWEETTVNVVIK